MAREACIVLDARDWKTAEGIARALRAAGFDAECEQVRVWVFVDDPAEVWDVREQALRRIRETFAENDFAAREVGQSLGRRAPAVRRGVAFSRRCPGGRVSRLGSDRRTRSG